MDRWFGKVAIVTGASSGIGAAVVESLVKSGLQVVGAARRVERVEEASNVLAAEKGKLYPIKVDMTNEEDILNMFEWVKDNLGGVDILINNAGILPDPKISTLSDGQTDQWKKLLDTNILGLCIATREVVRSMKSRNIDGHIVNISSVAGRKIPDGIGPFLNAYPATKYAVQALSEVLHQELLADNRKIKVSIVAPGGVQTEIVQDNSNENMMPELKDRFDKMTLLAPQDIADAILFVLGTPPNVLIKDLIITPVQEI